MEMKRWSTRWKTKSCLWDPTLTTIVTITFLLQAVNVKAGKELSLENAFLEPFTWQTLPGVSWGQTGASLPPGLTYQVMRAHL